MTSQNGQQIITIHIMPNISRNKANQAMKLSQVIEYNARNILFKNHGENKTGRLVPHLFCFFKKALHKEKARGKHFRFNIFW